MSFELDQHDIDEYQEEVYAYLNALRESGATNMFGAAPYIQEEFGFPPNESRAWLSKWMKDF